MRMASVPDSGSRFGLIAATLAIVVLWVVLLSFFFAVPKFKEVFDDLLEGEPLPALTNVVIGLSNFLSRMKFLKVGVALLMPLALLLPLWQIQEKSARRLYSTLAIVGLIVVNLLFALAMFLPMIVLMENMG